MSTSIIAHFSLGQKMPCVSLPTDLLRGPRTAVLDQLANNYRTAENPAFLREVSGLGHLLPQGLQRPLNTMFYAESLPYLLILGSPVDTCTGPTSPDWRDSDRSAARVQDFWLMLVISQKGYPCERGKMAQCWIARLLEWITPGKLADLRAWFPTDADCLDYMDWVRWPDGFVRPHGGGSTNWILRDRLRSCADCRRQVNVTAGKIFHRTGARLTLCCETARTVATQKHGENALGLQRVLGLGSYQSAWSMLHQLRMAMAAPGRQPASGEVEMDGTVIGGLRKGGKRGHGEAGETLFVVPVERAAEARRGFGRIRLRVIRDASVDSFVVATVEPGTAVIADAFRSWPIALGTECEHLPINIEQSGVEAHEALPGVHRVASLVKRWLDGTHQGGVAPEHFQAFLDEFTFRFNWRRSRQPGLLYFGLLVQAIATPSITCRELVASSRPKKSAPTPTRSRTMPRTLASAPVQRPWRSVAVQQKVLHSHG